MRAAVRARAARPMLAEPAVAQVGPEPLDQARGRGTRTVHLVTEPFQLQCLVGAGERVALAAVAEVVLVRVPATRAAPTGAQARVRGQSEKFG
jgi:hypothetical protein